MRSTTLLALTTLFLTPGLRAEPAATPASPATTAAARDGGTLKWWNARHELIKKRAEAAPEKVELVFVGDSITQGWEGGGKAEWAKHYARFDALNLGISGDRTEHVLWRLQNGEWPAALKPKVAVVMIGTNNTAAGHKPEAIAEGVRLIVEDILKRSADTQVVLLAVFPRGATPADAKRLNNDKVNAILAKLDGRKNVHFLDIGPKFLDASGTLSKSIMPDLLHPDAAGYKIWADALDEKLKEYGLSRTK